MKVHGSSQREPLDPEGTEARVVHSLVRLKGRDVLEIGAGNGRLTWCYAQRSASVIGLDSEERHVIRARAAMPTALRNRVDFRVADAATIELPRAAFDVVLFSWSI